MKKRVLVFVLSIFLFNCGSKKAVTTKKAKSKTRTERVVKTDPKSNLPKNESVGQSKTKVYANATSATEKWEWENGNHTVVKNE